MRTININSWIIKTPDEKEQSEDLLVVLTALVQMRDPAKLPKGLDAFMLFKKLTTAFEKATTSKVLVLEEPVYAFLLNIIKTDIPSQWATNKNIYDAINDFVTAKEE